MKKRLFKNEPNRGDRGHYVFFDNNATNFNDSNSVAINLFDKYDKRDLLNIYKSMEETLQHNISVIENYDIKTNLYDNVLKLDLNPFRKISFDRLKLYE